MRINNGQYTAINNTEYGCPALDPFLATCVGAQKITFNQDLTILGSTNWQPRASTGVELQVFLPVINAPFRIYWAYNPLRVDEVAQSPVPITRSMFPVGAAGDYTFKLARNTFSPQYLLREPRKTFRFTVGTTF